MHTYERVFIDLYNSQPFSYAVTLCKFIINESIIFVRTIVFFLRTRLVDFVVPMFDQ